MLFHEPLPFQWLSTVSFRNSAAFNGVTKCGLFAFSTAFFFFFSFLSGGDVRGRRHRFSLLHGSESLCRFKQPFSPPHLTSIHRFNMDFCLVLPPGSVKREFCQI